jgi:hypothetical protein
VKSQKETSALALVRTLERLSRLECRVLSNFHEFFRLLGQHGKLLTARLVVISTNSEGDLTPDSS